MLTSKVTEEVLETYLTYTKFYMEALTKLSTERCLTIQSK